jgi:hypothetical protein
VRTRNKRICGVGVNDADYEVNVSEKIDGKWVKVFRCPYYEKWRNMVTRCYSKQNTSYIDCTVCDDWLYFSNFKSWMEKQDWEGNCLDKDLLVKDNKTYSPTTCLFVPEEVNKFLQDAFSNKRSGGVKGYYFDKRRSKFVAQCSDHTTGKLKHLGMFINEEDAHVAWKNFKYQQAILLAKNITDIIIAEALVNRFKP